MCAYGDVGNQGNVQGSSVRELSPPPLPRIKATIPLLPRLLGKKKINKKTL